MWKENDGIQQIMGGKISNSNPAQRVSHNMELEDD
jgi:hypothetical protein